MTRVGDHRQVAREPGAARCGVLVKCLRQLGGDRALTGPAIDEQNAIRVMPGRDVVERDHVDPAAAHDGH